MTNTEIIKKALIGLFQYRKRYEVTCDKVRKVEENEVPEVSIPQAV